MTKEILLKVNDIEIPNNGTITLILHPNRDVYLGTVVKDVKIGTAIELPPHGRCIDADKYANQWDYSCGSGMYDEQFILDTIDEAPTILEAST